LYLLPDKDVFQKDYKKYIKRYDNYLSRSSGLGDHVCYIPREYYTKEIIEDILYSVSYNYLPIYLINQYADGFDSIIKEYLLKNIMYINLLGKIKYNIDGYYELCESLIKVNPSYIEYVSTLIAKDKLESLCELAVSIDGMVLREVKNKINIFSNINIIYTALENNLIALRFVPTSMDEYYSFLKFAYERNKRIVSMETIPKDLIDDLIKDFPEDREYLQKYLLKEYISKEVKKLLREVYIVSNNDVYLTEKIEVVSDKNKFDIIGFDKYLRSFGDNVLHKVLFNKRYIIPSKERFQKNYMNILIKNNTVKNIHGYEDEKYGYLSSLIPKEYYTKEMVDKIVNHFGLFTVVKKSLINQNVDGFANLVKEYITNRAYYSILAYINPYIEGYYDMFKFAIEKRPSSIAYLNTEFDRYEELALFAVSIDANTISNIPEYKRSYNVCLKAVSQDGLLISRVPEDVENYYSLLKVAYLQNRNSIKENKLFSFYIDILKKDFPEDEELQKKKGFDDPFNLLKELISREVKKVLKEYYLKKR
jgi:hypothetical protein